MNTSKYSFQDFLKYQKMLEECAKNNSTEVIFNDSIVHAVLIFASMLEKAVEDGVSQLNLYCGKASLFRDSTQSKVENEWAAMKPTDSSLVELWSSFKPYERFKKAFEAFDSNDGTLNIVIDNQEVDDFTNDSFLHTLKKMQRENRLSIKQMPFSLGMNHFAYIGNSYRCENSDEEKTALCCFNDNEQVGVYQESFRLLQGLSNDFKITKVA